MTSVQALFLDLDDTLVDGSGRRDATMRAVREIGAACGLDAARLSDANRRAWQSWPEAEGLWELGIVDGDAVTLEVWRRTLLACGRDDPTLTDRAKEIHLRHLRGALRLFDDARELLDSRNPQLPLAVITNGASDSQREKLRALDVEHEFDAIVVSGEVGVVKPDASIFRLAVDALRVEPERVWHVGDSLRSDVAGAKAAGLTAVWLNRLGARRGDGDAQPDHEIRSLRELAALLSART